MSVDEQLPQQCMNVCGERLEGLVITVEAVNVDYKELASCEWCF
jgi:hypothetical protein